MEEIKNIALEEMVGFLKTGDIFRNEVIVLEISGKTLDDDDDNGLPVRLDAFSAVFVSKGELTVTMDYLPYRVTQNMILELSGKYMLNSIRVSHDAKGYFVMLSKSLFREVFSQVFTIPKEYVAYKRFNPMQKLDVKDFHTLIEIILRLSNNIRRTDHVFHRGVVMNEVGNFLMELAEISMKQLTLNSTEEYRLGSNETIAMKFMQLIVTNGRKWNEVSQYSTELCVTPVYLSRLIKSITGKTAMDWINEARISEAKIMMRNKDISIQEIAEELNFSDQSSFGKFFKKHAGVSPLEYKKSLF